MGAIRSTIKIVMKVSLRTCSFTALFNFLRLLAIEFHPGMQSDQNIHARLPG